ncbi:homodimeric glycerol 3-phosphate dehydrogenase (quinone) [Marininema mesophilum]|uniref:Glycerol-3-phosphate dehydrogenase n=1 Tax=Marininema mesophilum TaxID=1048340 RepID=A0A1H2Q5V7_9BACL|nr:glycerol-3-phosphate dehydrogenase/oxidase [Marininema mesophilum]SDW02521.1 homodimeric glycerol 3-phosphate dehydrogenase (quinone) [Marininema mesophilum]
MRFSAKSRIRFLEEMQEDQLDLLVIGGGITGAGIAWDAASRGLKVGLVEKQDYAGGTSSRSTKLIHGGLRYLKQFEINLVREVGQERALLFERAPHIVIPQPMMLPIYQGGTYGKFSSSIGLAVYDRLAGVIKEERRKMLSKDETLRQEPMLKGDGLKGSGLYVEYRTDDARLTVEVMKTAASLGAKTVNYAEAESFIYENDRVLGARIKDRVGGGSYEVRAKEVVNAAGPWVDTLREKDASLSGKRLHLTKGVHIVVPHERLPLKQPIYFDVPDGRMIFAIPRAGVTYIGTTDTNYNGSIDKPTMTVEDRDYLLEGINSVFLEAKLTAQDVESGWAGIRPLIHEEGKDPSELSRKDEIFESKTGLITIAGGKLTGFRKMAERVVDLVNKRLEGAGVTSFVPCKTDRLPISGGGDMGPKGFERFKAEWIQRLTDKGTDPAKAEELVYLYGRHVAEVWKRAGEEPANLEEAQVAYAIEEEMAVTPADYLIRRTGNLYFNRKHAEETFSSVLAWMGQMQDWDGETLEKYRSEVEEEMARTHPQT